MHGTHELYVGESDEIYLTVENNAGTVVDADGPVTVDVINQQTGIAVVTDALAVREGIGTYFYRVPRTLTTSNARYTVRFEYVVGGEARTEESTLEVSTPYATVAQVQTAYLDLAATTPDVIRATEKVVRQVIEAFCGQGFGKRTGTLQVVSGVQQIDLPERIISVDSVVLNGSDVTINYRLNPQNPFALDYTYTDYAGIPTFYDVKSDTYYSRLNWHRPGQFQFTVTGTFGWISVPSEVNTAAIMLIRDFLDHESVWRERNLETLTTGDSRIAWRGDHRLTTGNANADMLLERFRRYGFATI